MVRTTRSGRAATGVILVRQVLLLGNTISDFARPRYVGLPITPSHNSAEVGTDNEGGSAYMDGVWEE